MPSAMKWFVRLLSVYALVCSVHMLECSAPPEITCTSTIDGVECYFKSTGASNELSPDRVTIDGDLMFVGSTNNLFSFDVSESLRVNSVLSHCPDDETRTTCLQENDGSECYNFIRFLQPFPAEVTANDTQFTDKILACGSNAVSPKCTVHSRGNLSEWFYLTDQVDVGFSPYLSSRPMVGLLGTNAVFYSATVFTPYGSQRRIGSSPGVLQGSSSFSALTPSGDQFWLANPNVEIISMYEVDDYIYIFAREIALPPELDGMATSIYSRVMRICKNDQIEVPVQSTREYLTFQKARMRCSSVRNAPNYPYDYNEVQSTNLVRGSSGESVLYATFSSSANGPKGSAVCKFEFDSGVGANLASVFESVEYLAPLNGNPTSPDWGVVRGQPFVCPGQPGGNERDPTEVLNYQLLINEEVVPAGDNDIYTADGVVFTQIAAETLTYNGREYQIMFIGTDTGEIWQVVIIDNAETFEFRRASLLSGDDITYLQLTMPNNATMIRKLYYANADFLSEMTLGDCSKYATCHECMESNDPYCAWQNGSTCVNILLQPFAADQTTEALRGSSRVGEVCNSVLPTQTISSGSATTTNPGIPNIIPSNTVFSDRPAASTGSGPDRTSPPTSTCPPVDTSPTVSGDPVVGGLQPESSQSVPIAAIAGAVTGGLVIGIIIGLVVAFLGLATKRALLDTKSSSPAAIENGATLYNHNGASATSLEPTKSNGVSSPTSSGSSPGLDIAFEELEDDVITTLPPTPASMASKNKRVPKGRTPSTRWLRASESEGNPP